MFSKASYIDYGSVIFFGSFLLPLLARLPTLPALKKAVCFLLGFLC